MLDHADLGASGIDVDDREAKVLALLRERLAETFNNGIILGHRKLDGGATVCDETREVVLCQKRSVVTGAIADVMTQTSNPIDE